MSYGRVRRSVKEKREIASWICVWALTVVSAKANVYFDGRVVSHGITLLEGSKKTLGLIHPGEYHFDTQAPERSARSRSRVPKAPSRARRMSADATSTSNGRLVATVSVASHRRTVALPDSTA